MEPKEFCYWLQGFAELTGSRQPTMAQWEMISEHLQLVFTKVTSELGELSEEATADELRERITESVADTIKTIEELHEKQPATPNQGDAFCTQHGPLSYPQQNICLDTACTPVHRSDKKLC